MESTSCDFHCITAYLNDKGLTSKNYDPNNAESKIVINSFENIEVIVDNTSLNIFFYYNKLTFKRLKIDITTKILKTLDNCLEAPYNFSN
jgi:hypothetical protein